MSTHERSELKTGKRPQQVTIKTFKIGETLFEEGSFGKELYVIQEGRVGIYKQTPEGTVELATVEEKGIIGEMSLLDNQPRSATVKAKEKTKVIVIDEKSFNATLQSVPQWLVSILKILVSRLRDINKRFDQSVLRDKERGIVSLLVLLQKKYGYTHSSMGRAVDYELLVIEAYYICRLKKKEIENLVFLLEKRKLIELSVVEKCIKHVCIKDLEALELFYEFLKLKNQKKKFKELSISQSALNLLTNIAYSAQKYGKEQTDGMVLKKSHLLRDLAEKDAVHCDTFLIELQRTNVINIYTEENETVLWFQQSRINRIKKINEWLPRFEQELS